MQTLKLQFTNYSIQLITEQALDFFLKLLTQHLYYFLGKIS